MVTYELLKDNLVYVIILHYDYCLQHVLSIKIEITLKLMLVIKRNMPQEFSRYTNGFESRLTLSQHINRL